jgi:hypothetical protein
MPYKALTYLMVGDTRYSPGDSIKKSDLSDAGQTSENIKELLDGGAISENMDAEIHPDHKFEQELLAPEGTDNHVIASDAGNGGDNNG